MLAFKKYFIVFRIPTLIVPDILRYAKKYDINCDASWSVPFEKEPINFRPFVKSHVYFICELIAIQNSMWQDKSISKSNHLNKA